ncbi:transmembrane protein 51a [Callorhinchus milii]|uniref:transmembrane protein 51a n=1 Tax=Callorhinchus milii TaxID=7868 RepID=UPI0004573F61|nr:transmembrane protein 51a [Callorhinchus milii]XP_042199589.1 transmembrane protein 51a [Callorhinchus milii]XP_042199591.1 transmembrane protein 51a [Callorhinchus milii]XP_042199592.1 transmembrane protein 51a [Callorhinchus milii]XP_042199593.1 transmembrane protein 51a [Callorhinchus milii]XP_042199594.1 transmembrane protein 51a [Callorhinchus milii]|eukprot:gi/632984809/ref/XP_007909330.1/ PREDICTED: transmembrane protein 51 [Callorhinchus milii]
MASQSGGSQYALTALGVGLLALGIVMMVWSVMPGFGNGSGNDSNQGTGNDSSSATEQSKGKISQVSYLLCAGGVLLLLLSICLSVWEKKRRQNQPNADSQVNQTAVLPHRVDEEPSNLSVPSYAEVMQSEPAQGTEGAGMNPGDLSSTTLPSYESLVEPEEVGAGAGAGVVVRPGPSADPGTSQQLRERPSFRNGKLFSSKKVRRILSDKTHLKDFRIKLSSGGSGAGAGGRAVTIEPLTPPPEYEEGQGSCFGGAQAV